MKKIFNLFVFTALIITACSDTDTSDKEVKSDSIQQVPEKKEAPKTIADYFTPAGDSLIIPAFDITIELSAKAEQTLKAANETIIISAMFSGIPDDTTKMEYVQWGGLNLGGKQLEMPAPGTVRFSDAKISKKDFDALGSKDIQILVDVFSGRKSTQDNLLSCDFLEEPISKARLQKNVLKGKLIYGE